MVDTYTAILQKYIVKAFRENNITYATNRAENLPLPYLKLWEINTWIDEFKTHNEVEVRFYLDKWYNLKKVLCDKCKAKLFDKIDKSLKELGFKSGYNEED